MNHRLYKDGAKETILAVLQGRIRDAARYEKGLALVGFKVPSERYSTGLGIKIMDTLDSVATDATDVRVFNKNGDSAVYVSLLGASPEQARNIAAAVESAMPKMRRPASVTMFYRASSADPKTEASRLYAQLTERVQEAAEEQFQQEAQAPLSYMPA